MQSSLAGLPASLEATLRRATKEAMRDDVVPALDAREHKTTSTIVVELGKLQSTLLHSMLVGGSLQVYLAADSVAHANRSCATAWAPRPLATSSRSSRRPRTPARSLCMQRACCHLPPAPEVCRRMWLIIFAMTVAFLFRPPYSPLTQRPS